MSVTTYNNCQCCATSPPPYTCDSFCEGGSPSGFKVVVSGIGNDTLDIGGCLNCTWMNGDYCVPGSDCSYAWFYPVLTPACNDGEQFCVADCDNSNVSWIYGVIIQITIDYGGGVFTVNAVFSITFEQVGIGQCTLIASFQYTTSSPVDCSIPISIPLTGVYSPDCVIGICELGGSSITIQAFDCPECGCDTAPSSWSLHLSGITDGAGCSGCDSFNTTFNLASAEEPCEWDSSQVDINGTPLASLVQSGGFLSQTSWVLTLPQCTETPGNYLTYQAAVSLDSSTFIGGVACCDSIVLASSNDCDPCCDGFLDSVTLTPSCSEGMGGLLPTKSSVAAKPSRKPLLGDLVESALTKVGITSDKVSAWLGRPCNCKERKAKLNKLHTWAKGLFGGKSEDEAKGELEDLTR